MKPLSKSFDYEELIYIHIVINYDYYCLMPLEINFNSRQYFTSNAPYIRLIDQPFPGIAIFPNPSNAVTKMDRQKLPCIFGKKYLENTDDH